MKSTIMAVFIFFSGIAIGQPVATVLFAKDNVLKITSGAKNTLKRGMKLREGDAIETGSDGQVSIRYNNGTIVNLGSDSSYKILSYADDAEIQVNAQLNKGKLYSKTTGKKKESLKTPAVALAILGTEYRVYVANSEKTHFEVIEGSVSAHGKIFGPGTSVVATDTEVQIEPFPAEGNVDTSMSDPLIESNNDSTNSNVSQVELVSTSLVPTVASISTNEAISSISTSASTFGIEINCF